MAQRYAAQLLSGRPARRAVDVVERLLAVQAQDPRGARLSIRARSAGLAASDVDRALTEDRSLVVTWLNRGTLHLVRAEDYWWLHPLVTPPLFTGNARRLRQEGVSPRAAERGVRVVEDALASDGPLTRAALKERLVAAGVPVAGQALVHVLVLATLRGVAVRGPVAGRDQAYAPTRDWLGRPPPAVDRDVALGELARRYLAGHAPANDRDLARWAGLPLADARRGLSATTARPPSRHRAMPSPRLLGAYDPVLLGWESREPVVGTHRGIVTTNGLFRPFALVDGRAAGIWSLQRGRVALAPFAPLAAGARTALEADAADVERFLKS